MMKNSKLWIFLKGLIAENPVLVLVLGTCPTLAVTNSVKGALCMGLAATVVLLCSNVVISALRNIVPDTVRIPCYIVVISAFVTIVDLVMQALMPELHSLMGTFLQLIVVNCIIFARAESFASKNSVIPSAVDGLACGLGFTLALMLVSVFREVLGNGTIWGISIFGDAFPPAILVAAPFGGFLFLGIVIALFQFVLGKFKKDERGDE